MCGHRKPADRHVTWENVLQLFTGGQVVAVSNPVSPTHVMSQDIGIVPNLRSSPYGAVTRSVPNFAHNAVFIRVVPSNARVQRTRNRAQ
jgi:hypothetical protein